MLKLSDSRNKNTATSQCYSDLQQIALYILLKRQGTLPFASMESVRSELNKLQQQRAALEAEINERSARLNGPGQPGMHDSLIDKEVGSTVLHVFCVGSSCVLYEGMSADSNLQCMRAQHMLHAVAGFYLVCML
jgi:hypothetical protein